MNHVDTPQSLCQAGVARGDITPPVGIYHRMWGAAVHDKATGVHRPLLATLLFLRPSPSASEGPAGDSRWRSGSDEQLLVAVDHCIIDGDDMTRIRAAVSAATGLSPSQVHIALSHTHGSGWMSRSRAHFPGGELIGPYLDALAAKIALLAKDAQNALQPATIVYGQGRCALAAHRDYWDADHQQFVCGFNPAGKADDTVLVARISGADGGKCLASIVNYACHPTTLAWDNTALSPDYVGAMREVVEQATGAPCLFLQGASGDLGPREGFVGDWSIADRNGRQLGFAALSALEALPPPGTRFAYAGPVVSGTTIGTWKHEAITDAAVLQRQKSWHARQWTLGLAYRHDLPELEATQADHRQWLAEEEKARVAGDEAKARDCRALVEQANRQINRLNVLPRGKVFPYSVTLWKMGDALWVIVPGELYQTFQMALRARFPDQPVMVVTLTGDWQPGYLPAASAYGYGIYQDVIAAVAAGSLEVLIEAIAREIASMLTE